ncbi:hypothetical protein GYMLUDRAFT_42125, partial [Collybiopsis luxurians FD-317 M1]
MAPLDYDALGFKEIIAKLDSGILIITINRAKQRNSFGDTLPEELIQVFGLADRDDRVQVVILTAEDTSPAYCSGVDISKGRSALFKPEETAEGETAHRDTGGQVSLAIYSCRKITIAAVNGHAAGVGVTALQLPFDLRFVWEGAELSLPFVRQGISPESASSYLLPHLLGHSRSNALLLTGTTLSPTSPLISSLYYEIIPKREDVLPAALSLAKDLAVNTSQLSVSYTKGLLQHPGDSIEENHILDSRSMKLHATGGDAAEGVRAFRERRLPKFPDTLSENSSPWYPWWKTMDVRHRKAKL